jgi:hypothetical protein
MIPDRLRGHRPLDQDECPAVCSTNHSTDSSTRARITPTATRVAVMAAVYGSGLRRLRGHSGTLAETSIL